ncbi:MAG TPA: histidine phosphatase family protein [Methylomirabilota bacterium]|nr:histidine phosphatase family protein [Methylomirabilota bacterium]
MRIWRHAGAVAVALAVAAPSALVAQTRANPPLGGADLLAALRGGGYIIYFRHGDTDWSQNDRRMKGFDDCANQRPLADKGREHSRQIGEAIRALQIPIGAVLASPMCRTVETAVLAFGRADKAMAVVERRGAAGTPERYAALRALMAEPVATGANTVIVGHAYPYYSLVGGQYLEEGEADVVRPLGTGFEVVARLGLKQWRELASVPAGR